MKKDLAILLGILGLGFIAYYMYADSNFGVNERLLYEMDMVTESINVNASLVISGISVLLLFYGVSGRNKNKNITQPPANTAYYPPPPQAQPQQLQPQQPEEDVPLETKLADLTKLKDSGTITEDEYKSMRQSLLNSF